MKTLATATIVLLCWAMVVVTGVLLVLWWVQPAQAAAPQHRAQFAACDGSDTDTSCVWHLPSMGEGDGFHWSFYVGRDGRVYRLPDHVALNLLTN